MELAPRYAIYLVEDGPALPRLALEEAVALARIHGAGSWWSDLQHALANLPVPVYMNWQEGAVAVSLAKACNDLASSLVQYLWERTMVSSRLPLLQSRFSTEAHRSDLAMVVAWQLYLEVERAPLRAALARFMASEHPLASVAL